MDVENFRLLIEIQNLENKIPTLLKDIAQENDRVAKMSKKISQTELELQEFLVQEKVCKEELSAQEGELFKVEGLLEKNLSHGDLVNSNTQAMAIEKEYNSLTEHKDQLENKILQLIDKQIYLQKICQEKKEFLAGSHNSRKEIIDESASIIGQKKKNIQNIEKQVQGISLNVAPSLWALFTDANKNYRFKHPIAFLEEGHCNRCNYMANSVKERAVDLLASIEMCEGCGRLLAPQASQSNHLRA